MVQVTLAEAAKMADVSKATLQRAVRGRGGKPPIISASRDNAGRHVVDVAELARVYDLKGLDAGDAVDAVPAEDAPDAKDASGRGAIRPTDAGDAVDAGEVERLRQEVERLRAEAKAAQLAEARLEATVAGLGAQLENERDRRDDAREIFESSIADLRKRLDGAEARGVKLLEDLRGVEARERAMIEERRDAAEAERPRRWWRRGRGA